MSRLLYRVGRVTALHPWRTLLAWVLLAAIAAALAVGFGGSTQDDYDVDGARAQVGLEQLRDHLPAAGFASAGVVVHSDGADAPLTQASLRGLGDRLAAMPHVLTVAPPRTAPGGDTAILEVGYDVPVTHPDLMGDVGELETAVAPTRSDGLTVELSGEVPGSAASTPGSTGEVVGVIAALVILVLALGSVVAAGLPLAVALVGLGVGSAGIALLASVTDVSGTAPTVATMVGLGVGIDYALLLVSRYVEHLGAGSDMPDAAGRAVATAGRSVVFAGTTVLVSLMGLRLAGLPTFDSFGFATAIAVVAVMATALTLVPALCRLGGRRMLPRRVRRGGIAAHGPTSRRGLTARWAGTVGRRPLPWLVGAGLVMVVLAAPVLDMRTWPQDASTTSTENTVRRAYDLVADEFGPGYTSPLTLVVDRSAVPDRALDALSADIADRGDVVEVSAPVLSDDGDIAILEAVPAFGPTDERTPSLVASLRAAAPAGVEVTGETAMFSDLAEMLAGRLWVVVGFVVAVSFLLLLVMFRSVVVPLKAALLNVLSVGAAYGVLTAVFQWGWGAGALGVDQATPISSWLPILMFTILFGLSMDYEVFLLSRVREDWERTGDARGSVVRGLAGTGRVISSAAAIMVAVFLGFATDVDVVVKMLGLGMAVAIALDATLVRLVMVPASMSLLGERNWWVPAWLDRILPHVRAELDHVELDASGAAPGGDPAPGPDREPALV